MNVKCDCVRVHSFAETGHDFLLDAASGTHRQVATERLGAPGYGIEISQGGWWRGRKTVVAVYTDGEALLFRIGDRVFDLADPDLSIGSSHSLTKGWSLAVTRGGREELRVWYRVAPFGQSDPWGADFFDYVREITRSRRDRLMAIYRWSKSSEGVDVTTAGFRRDLNDFLAQHGEPPQA